MSSVSTVLGHLFRNVPIGTAITRGQLAWVDAHDLGDLVSAEEVLIDNSYDLDRVPFEPDLIVDCGAHIGLFALIAGVRFQSAPIIAYEANPRNAAAACKQLRRFGARASVIEAALFDRTGSVLFAAEASNAGRVVNHAEMGQRVAAVDFRSECVRWAGRKLLLKMDVEGAEFRILPNGIDLLPADCAIFLELHEWAGNSEELTRTLRTSGFSVDVTREREGYRDIFALRTASGNP